MYHHAIHDFLMLLATIDPMGTLAIFVSLTAHLTASERRRVAWQSVAYGGLVLFAFLFLGQLLLSGLGIRLVSFQLAGGIILFLLGLQMIFGTGIADISKPEPHHNIAVFPLALPSIASPGALMATVLLTDNHRFTAQEQMVTGVILLVVLLLTLLCLLVANHVIKIIGRTGSIILIKVMGLLLASLAMEEIVQGVEEVVRAMQSS